MGLRFAEPLPHRQYRTRRLFALFHPGYAPVVRVILVSLMAYQAERRRRRLASPVLRCGPVYRHPRRCPVCGRGFCGSYEETVFRRLGLVLHARSHFDGRQGVWQRGRRLRLTDEQADAMEPWARYMARRRATRPRRQKGAPLMRRELWWTAAAAERFAVSGRFEAAVRTRVITGSASVFGALVPSSKDTTVEPEAFLGSLRQRPQVPTHWQQDSADPASGARLTQCSPPRNSDAAIGRAA
jgi:hypothetical protein